MSEASSTLVNLPIESIRLSTTNPRRSFDPAAMQELIASIRSSGIHVPLLARPLQHDGMPKIYELVAGERRLKAAREADLIDVPCIVREMTDAEAREAQIVENLQRADVPPVEEAESFGELLTQHGSIAAVAARLGKEQSYVAKSLRLLALTLHARDALRGGLITIDHALLLARLAPAEQNDALKWTLDRNAGAKMPTEKVVEGRLAGRKQYEEDRADGKTNRWSRMWECESVVRLREHIEGGTGIKLSRAPWLLYDDYLLPDVVPCDACPKNTKANAPLFSDLAINDATCTDGACFQAKTAAFVQIEMRKAGHDDAAKPKKLVPRLSWKVSSVKPSIVSREVDAVGAVAFANPAKVLKYGQWLDVKKGSCPDARPGITADWSDSGDRGYGGSGKKLRKPGETLLVCIAVGCKVHPKAWEKAKSGGNNNQAERHDPVEEERKREERDFIESAEEKIRDKVYWAILGKLNAAQAIHRVADSIHQAAALRKQILAVFPQTGGEQLEALVVFFDSFHGTRNANGYWLTQPGGVAEDRKDMWDLAKSAGVDADAIAAKYCADANLPPYCDRLRPGKAAAKKTPAKASKKVAKKAAKPAAKKAAKKKAGAR